MQESVAVREGSSMGFSTIPVSVKGKWVDAPALCVNGQNLVIEGKRVKIARLHDEDWMESPISDPEACIRACKEQSRAARPDIFTFSQKIPDVTPRYSYPMELRSLAVANVGDYKQWLRSLSDSTKINIKRAAKRGVVVKVREFDTDVIQGICDVQNESPVRQGKRFWHYRKPFEQVKRDHGSFADRSDFLCAYFEEEFIGFLKLVYRDGVGSIMQVIAKMAHYDKRTSNALIAKAAERCAEKGVPYLHYEQYNYGKKQDTSLREFKQRHGFAEMLVPAYYIPLTAWGSICMKTGLHHGLHGVAPQSLISAGLKARAAWYKWANR